jgi:peroxiredoxin
MHAAAPHEEDTDMRSRSLAIALGLIAAASPAFAAGPVVGEAAPAFSLRDEQGAEHALARYVGRVVVLEWTNPGCPFVQRHYKADTMERLSRAYPDAEVVWLSVNSTHDNTPEASREFKAEQGFDYPVLQDASGAAGRAYGARTTPHMFVIDPKGVLAYQGAIDDDPHGKRAEPKNYVEAALGALKAGAAPTPSETEPYGCSVKYASR